MSKKIQRTNGSIFTIPSTNFNVSIDAVALEARAHFFKKRSLKKNTKLQAIKLAISMIDLTTLEGMDTPGKVAQLCARAKRPALDSEFSTPSVAAVCVYPNMVPYAVEYLEGSSIEIASVATGFPSGLIPLSMKVAEVKYAVKMGATEIDMVIDRGAFLQGRYQYVYDEIRAIKEACADKAHLKVILETGELHTYDLVRAASWLAMEAGADFIKTSTGKVQPAATLPVTLVMLQAIQDFYDEYGIMVGMKPAGGIRDTKTALSYLCMLQEVLGDKWVSPRWFRFGASALLTDLLKQYAKQTSGRYYDASVFSQY